MFSKYINSNFQIQLMNTLFKWTLSLALLPLDCCPHFPCTISRFGYFTLYFHSLFAASPQLLWWRSLMTSSGRWP